MSGQPRIVLRLDDGSLVGPSQVLLGQDGSPGSFVRVSVQKALELGRAGDKEVARLERLLNAAAELAPPPPAPAPAPAPAPVHLPPPLPDAPGAKKARLDSGANGAAGGDWYVKCRSILLHVRNKLGSWGNAIFGPPVDRNVVPDYYTIIKNPMCLDVVDRRLVNREYSSPQDFAEDMRLIWSNCRTYNKKGTDVCKVGDQADNAFETEWAKSGFAGETRSKRATAGVAAPKYEPEIFEPPSKPKPSQSKQKGPKSSKGNGVTSHHHAEVTSKGAPRVRPLTEQRRAEIANELAELDENGMAELATLLPKDLLPQEGDEEAEFELDFNALDDETLARIDAWLASKGKGAAQRASPSRMSHNPSVRLDQDSSDSDYNSESD